MRSKKTFQGPKENLEKLPDTQLLQVAKDLQRKKLVMLGVDGLFHADFVFSNSQQEWDKHGRNQHDEHILFFLISFKL